MAKTVTVEFGPWEPDAALLNGQQAPEAQNVIPAKRGYRSMPSMERGRFDAMAQAVMEMFSTKDMSDNMITVAATSGKIYALEWDAIQQKYAWTERYSDTPITQDRYFVQYGNELYALFGSKLLRQASAGTNFETVTQANGYTYDAPTGEVLGAIRDFLVIGRLTSTPNAIQWSGIDRPAEWPTPGTNAAQYIQSDIQVFPVGGQVQTIVGAVGGVDGLVFLERAIQRATYVGPPYIFQFDPVDWQQGTISPKSPVVCGQQCFFLSEDGWKATDGASVRPIGLERIDRWFFDMCDMSRVSEVRGVHDSAHRLAIWSFPTDGAPAGVHDRLLIYSYALDRWSYAQIDVECIFSDYSRGLTLEELDDLLPQTVPVEDGGIDTPMPPRSFDSFDSAQLKNGMRILGCVDTAHTMCAFTGSPLQATIDTAEFGGGRMMVHGFRPLVDCGNAQAMPIWRILQRYGRRNGKYTTQQRDGVCYQHLSCDYVAARIMIPAFENDGNPTAWRNAVAVEALIEEEGGL
jgi:hypothetical protein